MFAEFWAYDAPQVPCCLMASDEDVDADPEPYDCEACPVAGALHALEADAENVQAWRLFRQVVTRLTFDGHALGLVLDRLTPEMGTEDFADLVGRLSLLYDTLYPPPKPEE